MTKISRDQLRRIIRETKASVDAESSKKSTLSESTLKDISTLNEAKRAVALHEARLVKQLNEYTDLNATISASSEVIDVINENFFGNLKQGLSAMAKGLKRSAFDRGPTTADSEGGYTAAGLSEELPEMKELQKGLKAVSAAAKTAKSKKISDTEAVGVALMNYVKSLTDLYGNFKSIEKSEKAQNELPDVLPRLASAFMDARELIGRISIEANNASEELYNALRGSALLKMSEPETGGAVALDTDVSSASAKRGDISGRARGKQTSGGALAGAGPTAGGLAGGR